LNQSNNGIIRCLVINWVLNQKLPGDTYDAAFSAFLVGSLLKWCSQGYLFKDSLRRDGHAVSCSYGSKWAAFISGLLRSGGPQYTVNVLSAVKEHVRHPSAIGYTLCGIANGTVEKIPAPYLEEIDALTSSILTGSSLSLLQHRVFYVFAQSFLNPGEPVEGLTDGPLVAQFDDCHNMAEIHTLLCSLDPTIPKQNRLFSACLRATQIQPSESDGPILLDLFKDIWTFTQKQDFPRTILEILPLMFFGNALRINHKDLREFLSIRMMDLFRFCHTRVYGWNPLASAIHKAYCSLPDLASLLPVQDFMVAFARKPPVADSFYLLDSAISHELPDADKGQLFQPADEGRGYALVFDMMNRLRTTDTGWGRFMINDLIAPYLVVSKEALGAPNTMLQSVLLLSGRCLSEKGDIKDFRGNLLKALTIGARPDSRFLLEWIFLASYWPYPDQAIEILQAIDDATERDVIPKLIASLLKVASWMAKHDQVDVKYMVQLAGTLAAFCTSDKIAIRQEAGWRFWQLMDTAREKNVLEVCEDPTNKRIDRYIRTLKGFHEPVRFRELQHFDPRTDQTLGFLVNGDYLLLDEGLGVPRQGDFVDVHTSVEWGLPQGYLPLGDSVENMIATNEVPETSNPDADMPFQSKSFLPMEEADDLATSLEEKGGIILIASLITSLPNLGGLSRVAEIFGCEELHIANSAATKAHPFTSVSVSSETNVSIIETKPEALTSLLRAKSAEGWAVVGIEQTGSSLILGEPETRLPRRAVLVLGAERTGMPADVLVECDECVEIRQWGSTRSMNVQTAAATVLYEWRRQWGDGR
jgi:tRNA guanosine-2'-O-methyltransferase